MSDDDGHPANPYAGEAANAPRLEDRPGYPFKRRLSIREETAGSEATDEPTFVLRASDPLASQIVRLWAVAMAAAGKTPAAATADAWTVARRMDEWRRHNEAAAHVDGPPVTVAGHVKFFDAAAGYGYVVPDRTDMPDVMMHRTALRAAGLSQIIPSSGMRIEVEAVPTSRGWKAARILKIDYFDN